MFFNSVDSNELFNITKEVFGLLENSTDKIVKKIIDFKENDFFVLGNSSEIHQVLLNLGINSYKAIEERGFRAGDFIKISANNYISGDGDINNIPKGDYIHIIFSDNGRGMSEKILEKAFDPFFTTRDKNENKGLGLGLSMVFNIITKSLSGFININSDEGIGITVNIFLPKVSQNETIKSEEKDIDKTICNETILVIEDEEDVQNMIKSALEFQGYNVITANDGKEGLDKYLSSKSIIDLVVLDLIMPNMSGPTVLEEIMKVKNDAKVIISSGQASDDTDKYILTKAKGYIKKPYLLTEFFKEIRRVLESGKI